MSVCPYTRKPIYSITATDRNRRAPTMNAIHIYIHIHIHPQATLPAGFPLTVASTRADRERATGPHHNPVSTTALPHPSVRRVARAHRTRAGRGPGRAISTPAP